MDDVRAVPASLSGRFSALRSKQNQHRLRGDAAHGWEGVAGEHLGAIAGLRRNAKVLADRELCPA